MSNGNAEPVERGYIFVVSAAILWAVSGSAAKFLFNQGVSPFELVQMRLTLTAAALLVGLSLRAPARLRIAAGDILYFAVFGIVGMAGVQFTYLFAISKIKVAGAILLQYLAPSMIVLHSVMVMRERPRGWVLGALIGATLGCYLVVGAYNLDLLGMNLAGVVSGLLSAVGFAWYSVHGEYGMRRYQPWTVLFYAMAFAALAWNTAYPPLKAFARDYSLIQWAWIFYIGFFGTLMPFGLYLEGVNRIRSTRASITATLEPIAAGIFSYFFLGEIMEFWQMIGGALVIASVILLQLKQEPDDRAPSVIRAQRAGGSL